MNKKDACNKAICAAKLLGIAHQLTNIPLRSMLIKAGVARRL